ncbi:SpoIIIAH-like family protein [Paenibacillus abyssi]|uniref:SpoIIIAH-like family protein n=1 Tax=Paenibacillus abyssi TaxID=1340531 RepID=A0A917FJW8_9BACL|nr:SpoIIIAH-like family protein [Paenibacillus abyssi]GGF87054.1 hypothetical protein GCM10010916_00520 [Paenibacillus abyssi]
MNTKRQTVWLVSMLSLMVILSAYYLFTEDSGSSNMFTDAGQGGATEAAAGTNGADPTLDEVIVTEIEQIGESGLSEADQEVLNKLEENGAAALSNDYFTEQQLLRAETLAVETDRLLSIVADTEQKTEDATSALEKLNLLEEQELKLTSLEEELLAEYSNAVIAEENDNFKVVVQSEKLERSQADSIIELVMTTLDVGAERISVQFVP